MVVHHTPIPSSPKQPATAATFNAPLAQLDAGLVAEAIARDAQDDLILSSVGSGGWASTLDGAANSGQKVIPVVSTDGAIGGMPVYIGLSSGTHEVGEIASVQAGVSVTLVANLASTYSSGAPISATPGEVADARGGRATLGARFEGLSFDVKAFGAIGDGVADDTAAIVAAIAAMPATGGTLYFPPGRYKITSRISIPHANVLVLGAGNEYGPSFIVQATANTGALYFNYPFEVADVSASIIRGVVVAGPGGATSGHGVETIADLIVENCGIYGFFKGLYFGVTNFYSRVSGCLITDNANVGIEGIGTNNLTIRDSRINGYDLTEVHPFGNQATGVRLSGFLNARIEDCSFEGHDIAAIELVGESTVNAQVVSAVISGNYFGPPAATNGRYVWLNGASGGHPVDCVLISGNHFEADGATDFYMVDGTYAHEVTLLANEFGYGFVSALNAVRGDANSSGWLMLNNVVVSGTVALPPSSTRFDGATGWPIRPSGAKAWNSATQAIPGGSVETALIFNSEDWDTDTYHDSVTNNSRMTIPAGMGGRFRLRAAGFIAGAPTGYCSFRINGTALVRGAGSTVPGTGYFQWDAEVALVAGDYVEAICTWSTGQNIGHATILDAQAVFELERLGP